MRDMMYLYRYSNNSNLNKKINWADVFDNNIEIDENLFKKPVKIECFKLSQNDNLNGGYLSFLYADGIDSIERIKKCFSWYRDKRDDNFPLYFGFCEIDTEKALRQINDEKGIIIFSKKGELTEKKTIHYGMNYLTDDNLEILEAQNTLVLISKFFPCYKREKEKYLGCFSSERKIQHIQNLNM